MRPDSTRPVFIIGGSRTGSTMLETMLLKSPELNITDELLLRCPAWLRRDLATNIKKHVGNLAADGALEKLMNLLYSGIPNGWLWSAADRVLDRELLYQELSGRKLDLHSIFDAILIVHAQKRNKPRVGAKFPVHYSYTNQLMEWYPNCLLIHTTRNPKAVYASQAAKYLRDDQSWLSQRYMRFRQFVHINLQISWTARLHKQLRGLPNYRLIRYEDLVLDPENQIRALCSFIDVEFCNEMLQAQQFGSSFDDFKGGDHGVKRTSVDRWRKELSTFSIRAMDALHRRAYESLGYESDHS